MNTLLSTSNLILFFSLPFKPAGTNNLFFNGHTALALGDTVYHIVNPSLLRTDFLFSVMPVASWLYGPPGSWVDRNPASPSYTHVYLYRKCESTRTVVYAAGMKVEPELTKNIRDRFTAENDLFRTGARKYNLFTENCSSVIADALVESGLLSKSILNNIPSILFRRFVQLRSRDVQVKSIDRLDHRRFTLHRICYGLWSFNPRRAMDRWIASL